MNKYLDRFTSYVERGMEVYDGKFLTNNASNPDATKVKGEAFVVTRTGTGAYLVTFDQPFISAVNAFTKLQIHAAADACAEIGDISASAGTMVIRIVKKSTGLAIAADIVENANTSVSFTIKVKRNAYI